MRVGAKLNLYLKVTARRPDGYHELSTVFLPLSEPADELTLEMSGRPGIRLETAGADTGDPADNLVCRAARLYAEEAAVEPAWNFYLSKHIPVAAGLGGGSADAAAALQLLNRHYRRLDGERLSGLAVRLGADVPFFLRPSPAVGTGIGDRLRTLPVADTPLPLLLLSPKFPVSARWAYSHLPPERIGPETEGRLERLCDGLAAGDPAKIAANVFNDLGFALLEKFPLLVMLRNFALRSGALAAEISGSGPTLFLLFPNREERERTAEETRRYFHDGVRVIRAEAGTGGLEPDDRIGSFREMNPGIRSPESE